MLLHTSCCCRVFNGSHIGDGKPVLLLLAPPHQKKHYSQNYYNQSSNHASYNSTERHLFIALLCRTRSSRNGSYLRSRGCSGAFRSCKWFHQSYGSCCLHCGGKSEPRGRWFGDKWSNYFSDNFHLCRLDRLSLDGGFTTRSSSRRRGQRWIVSDTCRGRGTCCGLGHAHLKII